MDSEYQTTSTRHDRNSTVPAGVLAVPAAVSVTVAVHVEAWLMKTGVVHDTAVEVVRRLTVIVFEVTDRTSVSSITCRVGS